MTRLSLGHLHSIALCLYLCSHGHLGVGWAPLWGAGPGLYLVYGQAQWQPAYPVYSWAHLDALARGLGLTSRSACKVGGSVHYRPTSWSTPISMCEVASSLSLQGSDLPSKDDLYFFLLYFDKTLKKLELLNLSWGNLRTGLFGVVEPLTAFNTQLVINCFVYLFSVFISTSTVIIAIRIKSLNYLMGLCVSATTARLPPEIGGLFML